MRRASQRASLLACFAGATLTIELLAQFERRLILRAEFLETHSNAGAMMMA